MKRPFITVQNCISLVRFEYLDKHYLQKAFVRRSHITKNGWSAVSNYDKLSVNEAHELEQNTDYSAMLRQLQPENGMIRNFSFMRWLSSVSHGCFPYGYPYVNTIWYFYMQAGDDKTRFLNSGIQSGHSVHQFAQFMSVRCSFWDILPEL